MSGYVVIVDFRLRQGSRATFRALIDANAQASVREEPGCRRFDVIEPAGRGDTILLYEIYADRDAFEAHMRSEHFAKFDAAGAAYIVEKSIVTGELVCEGSS
jgi:(4S)-4-hydroxy-5-phosphonooxypentane-2,3-dione isomerase